jgi:hypothetical protein
MKTSVGVKVWLQAFLTMAPDPIFPKVSWKYVKRLYLNPKILTKLLLLFIYFFENEMFKILHDINDLLLCF